MRKLVEFIGKTLLIFFLLTWWIPFVWIALGEVVYNVITGL